MVPPRIIRSYAICPPFSRETASGTKVGAVRGCFPAVSIMDRLASFYAPFRDEMKAIDQGSAAKSRECPKPVRVSHSATLLQIVELQGALSQHRAPLALWQLFGNLGRGAGEKTVRMRIVC